MQTISLAELSEKIFGEHFKETEYGRPLQTPTIEVVQSELEKAGIVEKSLVISAFIDACRHQKHARTHFENRIKTLEASGDEDLIHILDIRPQPTGVGA